MDMQVKKKLGLKEKYALMTRGLGWDTTYQPMDKVFPYDKFEGIKIRDWDKWEDPFRLTMDAYWKYQAEKEKQLAEQTEKTSAAFLQYGDRLAQINAEETEKSPMRIYAQKTGHYFVNRFYDVIDIVDFSLGVGPGVLFNVHATKLGQIGGGYSKSVRAGIRGSRDRRRRDVAVHGPGRVVPLGRSEGIAETWRRRLHQRAVERATDGQPHHALGPRVLGQRHRLLHAGDFAGNHRLLDGVVVRGHDESRGGGLAAHLVDRPREFTQDRGHGARPGGARVEHQGPPTADEAHRIGQRQRARGVVGRELAQRVPGCRLHPWSDGLAHDCPHRRAMRKERRLRVVGQGQFFGRSLKGDAGERRAECGIGRSPHAARFRVRVDEVLGHAGLLGALAGKEQQVVSHARARSERSTNPR